MSSRYLTVEQAADEYPFYSRRTFQALAAQRRLPHRRHPGSRRIVIVRAELEAYLDDPGLELEVVELDGGRIVKPKEPTT